MEQLKLSNFISSYPDINDPNFTEQLHKKKELYDLILDKEEIISEDNQVLKHQKIISIFISSYTMYNSLLLFHSMGTGKSIAAIYTAQSILQQRFGITKIYFCSNTDIIRDNLMNELLKWDPTLQPNNFGALTENERKRRTKKKLEENNYYFMTFIEIYNEYNKTRKNIKRYEKSLMIFDEIHDITKSDTLKESTGVTNIEKYNTIKDIIDRITISNTSSKVLLMSGTPMTDKANEIAKILNLILPNKIVQGDTFDRTFLNEDRLMIDDDKIERFNDLSKGYVSYLKNQKSIKTKFIGENVLEDFVNLKLLAMKEGELQNEVMNELLQVVISDLTNDALGGNVKQASLFVFPNKSYGKEGYDTYITDKIKSVRDPVSKKMKKKNTYELGEELKGITTINQLKKYSLKYYEIFKKIQSKPDECHFVYCDLIKGSGLRLFSLLLENILGYRRSSIKNFEDDRFQKYIFLTGETKSSYQIKLINLFNEKRNNNGKFVNVILGTDKIKQGVSFNHIQHIHITLPHWNYSKTEQIIARGIRFGSHKFLNEGSIVNVYLYTLITHTSKSHDLKLYELCSKKDKSIKSVEHQLKLNAIDCNFFYNRNFIDDSSMNNSRDCDYTDCDYVCNYFDNNSTPINPYIDLDYSTFNEYYNECIVRDELVKLFKTSDVIFLNNFILYFENKNIDTFTILNCLYNIINKQVPILNKYGISMHLQEHKDLFYLTHIPLTQSGNVVNVNSNCLHHTYNSLLIFNYQPTLKLTLENKISILYNPDFNKSYKENIIKQLDDDIIMVLLSNSIISKFINTDEDNHIDFLLKLYKNKYNFNYKKKFFIFEFKKKYYKILPNTYELINNYTSKKFNKLLETNLKDIEQFANTCNFKYIGIVSGYDFDNNEDLLKIKELGSSMVSGKAFKSFRRGEVQDMFENLQIPFNPELRTDEYRSLIFERLKELSIVHYENFNEDYFRQEPTEQPKIVLPGQCGPPALQSPDTLATPVALASPPEEPVLELQSPSGLASPPQEPDVPPKPQPKPQFKPRPSKVRVRTCKTGAIINQLDINKLEIEQKFQDFLENQMLTKSVGKPTADYKVRLDGREKIITDIVLLTEKGTYGIVYKLTLNDNSIFLVKLTKKRDDTLEENKLVDKVPDECRNVLPIRKFGRKSVMMLYADTVWEDIYMGDAVIKNIVKIIGNALLCLMRKQLYYFDLKLDNILYRCLGGGKNIEIFLADLGSMVPFRGTHIATYPPIELMGMNIQYSYNKQLYSVASEPLLPQNHKNGYIYVSRLNEEDIEKAYVWILCILYIQLKALQDPSKHLLDYVYKLSFSNKYMDYKYNLQLLRDDPKIHPLIKHIFSIERNQRPRLREFINSLN